MAVKQGTPAWYELSTNADNLAAAGEFYANILDWQVMDSGMDGFVYHLAMSDGDMVAGLMEMPPDACDVPPNWLIYIAVDDADEVAKNITAAGGKIFREPADIPGTGRFAIACDPQGAAFGIIQLEPMDNGQDGAAFDQGKAGHGNWTELMSTDPGAGFAFYSKIFGWQKSTPIDMGEMGTYQLFSHQGADIGGMMGLSGSPMPYWMPYFGVNGVNAAIERITSHGGKLIHGPQEVPGGAFIANAQDPQGALFSVVGPKEIS